MLIERFLEGKPSAMAEIAYVVESIMLQTHPAIQQVWKWNTLCFQLGTKHIAYFSVKKGKFQVGFWNKKILSSSLIHQDLKFVGYYLVEELSDELLADIAISAEETANEINSKRVN